MIDAWVCPGCFAIETNLGRHVRHLRNNKSCMKATLGKDRRSAVCQCTKPKCKCDYRTKVKS